MLVGSSQRVKHAGNDDQAKGRERHEQQRDLSQCNRGRKDGAAFTEDDQDQQDGDGRDVFREQNAKRASPALRRDA